MFSSSSSLSAGYNESAEEDVTENYESAEEDVAENCDITSRNPTTQSLQRWERATHAARRFRYTTNDSEEPRLERLRRFRSCVHAVRAVNRFLKAGAAVHVCDDFEVKPEKLVNMVQEHQFKVLEELGGAKGVASMLRTSPNLGLKDDLEELEARRKVFGSNTYPRQPHKQFWDFLIHAFKDLTPVILIVCAVLSLALDIKTRGVKEGWYDGISIAFAGILAILVSSIIDYRQYLQFSALNEEEKDIRIEVVRGGRKKEISIFQIVVGDTVVLNIGDQVPADGLLVDGCSLYINQSSLTGESEPIHVHHEMPFLVSGGKVEDGHGVMVVTSVGMLTEWGQLMAAIGDDTEEKTPLQVGLNGVANLIGKVGMTVATSVLIILLIFYFVVGHTEGPNNSGKFKKGQTSKREAFNSVVQFFQASMIVPEVLPLAVTLILAYVMKKMTADHTLVRRLSACETMGSATTICSDKTGILTLNQMTVVKAWVGGGIQDPLSEQESLCNDFLQVLSEGIVQNSNGTIFVPAEGGEPEVTGSPTEKAALLWGLKLGMDHATVRSQSDILQVDTFNSIKKRAGVAVRLAESGKVRVHWKGAAEIILQESDKLLHPDNGVMPISPDERNHLMNAIEGMASESLRCVAFAYMDMDAGDVPSSKQIEEWELPEGPLTLLAIVGIEDPIRPEVPEAVRRCQLAGIKVRMVTGDNLTTARAIATECGILGEGDIAIEGATFRNYTDEIREQELPRIKVMARSSPTDKLLMVRTLKQMGEVVAVTGDGTNDAPALREADVSLAMGIQGTEVAKESSDIVIMDDKFASVVKVVRWGRSVYLDIQKFIQFQLTVNVTALTLNFVVAVLWGDVLPLTAIQLLWVNLIMDTLGALALATERPTDKLLESGPIGHKAPLISNVMWRNIFSQALYQVIVLLVLQIRGKDLMRLSGSNADDINRTVIFNAFVFCQLFNEVNSPKLEERNVFRGLLSNWPFLGIVGTRVVLQIITVEFLNKFASTVKLQWEYWVISIVIGFLSWPLSFFVKFIPVPKQQFIHGMVRLQRQLRRSKSRPSVGIGQQDESNSSGVPLATAVRSEHNSESNSSEV